MCGAKPPLPPARDLFSMIQMVCVTTSRSCNRQYSCSAARMSCCSSGNSRPRSLLMKLVEYSTMQLGVCLTNTARGQARPGCSFKCDRPAQSRPMPSSMQLAEDLRPSVGWIQLCVRHTNTARGQARPGCSFGCDRLAPHHHGPRSGTTWMQLRVRQPCSALPHAKCDAACQGPARPPIGLDAAWRLPHHHGPRSGTTWMQLRVRPPCSARPRGKLNAAC